MKQQELLQRVKRTVQEAEPGAEIILYGSRARQDAGSESDWDFLVLVDGPMSEARADAIRHRLYEIEWETGEVLSAVVRSHQEWRSPRYRAMPFWQNIQREGVTL